MARSSRTARVSAVLIGFVVLVLASSCSSADPNGSVVQEGSTSTTPQVQVASCSLPVHWTWSAHARPGPVPVFDAPGGEVTATLANPRVLASEPPVEVPLVLLVTDMSQDCRFAKVLLPQRPNGSSGWIPVERVELFRNANRIEVSRTSHRLTLWRADESGHQSEIASYPVAVGTQYTPTPLGTFSVTEAVAPPAGSAYGPLAMGLSGFSEALETFNGAPAQIAIHGTNDPASIGHGSSNGCIRMNNDDITALAKLVPLGTPVIVKD